MGQKSWNNSFASIALVRSNAFQGEIPVGSAIEGVDAGDDPPHVVLVIAHCHWVAVEVVSARRISIAVACMTTRPLV